MGAMEGAPLLHMNPSERPRDWDPLDEEDSLSPREFAERNVRNLDHQISRCIARIEDGTFSAAEAGSLHEVFNDFEKACQTAADSFAEGIVPDGFEQILKSVSKIVSDVGEADRDAAQKDRYMADQHESFNSAVLFIEHIRRRFGRGLEQVVGKIDVTYSDKLEYAKAADDVIAVYGMSEMRGIVSENLLALKLRNQVALKEGQVFEQNMPHASKLLERINTTDSEVSEICALSIRDRLRLSRGYAQFSESRTGESAKLRYQDVEALVTLSKEPTYVSGEDCRSKMPAAQLLSEKMHAVFDIDGEELFDEWFGSVTTREPQILLHVQAMTKIEQGQKGAVKHLYEKQGIRHFGRYSVDLMADQIKARESKKPYGIVLYPVADHNGAFMASKEVIGRAYPKIKEAGYELRVFETESLMQTARHLISLDRNYGSEHKIEFAFIGGHGAENTIEFGSGTKGFSLDTKDLFGKGIKKASSYFENDPTIVLFSCSTGAEGGISTALSEQYHARVIAPSAPDAPEYIGVTQVEGKIGFDVRFRNKKETVKDMRGTRS
jgi:hypothetical protein